MKTVTVDKLTFKNNLSMIEQIAIKDFLLKWIGGPTEGLDDFPLRLSTQKVSLRRWSQNRLQLYSLMGINISDMPQ